MSFSVEEKRSRNLEAVKRWAKAHPDKRREIKRRARLANAEHYRTYHREYSRKWRKAKGIKLLNYQRKRYWADPGKARQQRLEWYRKFRLTDAYYDQHYRKHFGITLDDYNKLLAAQDGKCAICRKAKLNNSKQKRLSVDHCHKTGKVRGLLCDRCNHCLSVIEKDPDWGNKARAYLCL